MDSLEEMLVPEMAEAVEEGEASVEETSVSPDEPAENDEGTQGASEEEAGDDGQDNDPSKEEVVPKSQYDHLRVDYTKKAMELAALKKEKAAREETTAVQTPQYEESRYDFSQVAPLAGGYRNYIQAQIDAEVNKALEPLKEERQRIEIRETVAALEDKYPDDFDNVALIFIEMLEEDPSVLDSFELSKGVEVVFKAARADYLDRVSEAKVKAEIKAKETARVQKRVVSESVPATQAKEGELSEEDTIRDSILGVDKHGGSIFNF